MNEQEREPLRQRLLELHYGLLDDGDADALRQRIMEESELAGLWAETRRMADQFAVAAAWGEVPETEPAAAAEDEPNGSDIEAMFARAKATAADRDRASQVGLADAPAETLSDGSRPQGSRRRGSQRRGGFAWKSFLAVAATLLLVVGMRAWQRLPERPAAALVLRATPVSPQAGIAPTGYRVTATQATGSGLGHGSGLAAGPIVPASVTFSIFSGQHVLYRAAAPTERGTVFDLPDDVLVPQDAMLRIEATSEEAAGDATLEIPLPPTRCVTYLRTDRPVYRPGEAVFFRSLTLERSTLRGEFSLPVRYELRDPAGGIVPDATLDGVTDRGVGNGVFRLPATLAGGTYELTAKSLDGFFPEETVAIEVRAYRVPKFTKRIELNRRSYGPGEAVEAVGRFAAAAGDGLAGAPVQATVRLDGQVRLSKRLVLDDSGTCRVTWRLPEFLDRGEASISMTIDDGGTRETVTKTISIPTQRVELDFYPESGYLVGGLRNRVYFAAHDPAGRPVEVAGEVRTAGGRRVARFETSRDGMGLFSMLAEQRQRYVVHLDRPLDVRAEARFPAVVGDRPLLDTGPGVFAADEPLVVQLRSTSKREVRLRVSCRGRRVGVAELQLTPGTNRATVPFGDGAAGVLRVTVLEADSDRPLAERLVFRRGAPRLQVRVMQQAGRIVSSPGQPQRLTLEVTDEAGKPAAATLGVAVVDEAALAMRRQESPTMRTHFYLTSEVERPEDLEHANVYLSDVPGAATGLDLLLGTQGWRRFVEPTASPETLDEQLARLMALDADQDWAEASNAGRLREQWTRYRQALDRVFDRALAELRWLILPTFLLWAVVAWLRQKFSAPATALALLLLGGATLLVGCGVQQEAAQQVASPAEGELDAAGDVAANAPEIPAERDDRGAPADLAVERAASIEEDASSPPLQRPVRPGDRAEVDSAPTTSIDREKLRRVLAARGIDADEVTRRLLEELRFPIREYAHRYQPSPTRSDFAETLLWEPLVTTDADGRATIRFDLPDSLTTFRVQVDAHSADGRLGSGGGVVVSRLPVEIDPKMPLAVTAGDVIRLPIAMVNRASEATRLRLTVDADARLQREDTTESRSVLLAAEARKRQSVVMHVREDAEVGEAEVTVRGIDEAGEVADQITRALQVAPAGFAGSWSHSQSLAGKSDVKLQLPETIIPGSLAVQLRAFPSPVAEVVGGVEGILAEPHGCFEQASATNYPNALVLKYLRRQNEAPVAVTRRAAGLLQRGYAKLTQYECRTRGFEWFGDDPGHEALSAFGLLQFNDMRDFVPVDLEMIARTRRWLMARRDGEGSWKRNPRHLHRWAVTQAVVDAYVLWALLESDAAVGDASRGAAELRAELDQLQQAAAGSRDPYLLALSAAAFGLADRPEAADRLRQRLVTMQADDGSLQGIESVTQSGGKSLRVETTALAVIAWNQTPKYAGPAGKAAAWLGENRSGSGGFGSTQATVLALKALVSMRHRPPAGTLTVRCNGVLLGKAEIAAGADAHQVVEIADLAARLTEADLDAREATLQLQFDGEGALDCVLSARFHTPQPIGASASPLELSTRWGGDARAEPAADPGEAFEAALAAGEVAEVLVELKNKTAAGLPMTVAVIGLPGGTEPRIERLEELREAGVIDYYELRPREVITYWRRLEPEETKRFRIEVTAEIPGRYTAPPARSYPYYTAEQTVWAPPLVAEITEQ